ncbi:phosphate-starvation-inducible PsiE family protein [Halovenus amylolytica]|uniref:phosphate-starvation-inducible PsiE family protein n=1 Tax=Halovenus amylolytica TaxID=2500550 RepID=UPI00360DB3CB
MSLDPARATEPSAVAMQWLVLAVAYFTLGLFLIGVFDLLLGLWELITSGTFTDPAAVVGLLNSVLLLLIIVEVHRTLIAYARDEPVVRIVVGAAIIAVAREIIGFRIGEFETITDGLIAAGGFGILLVGLGVAYFVVRYTESQLEYSDS